MTRLAVAALTAFLVAVPDKGGLPLKKVDVAEPTQSALIAFNGTTEMLWISSVLRPKEKTRLLEILPLPSEPTVELADPGVIERAAAIYNRRVEEENSRRAAQEHQWRMKLLRAVLPVLLVWLAGVALLLWRRSYPAGFALFAIGVAAAITLIPGLLAAQRASWDGSTVAVVSEQKLGPHSITVVKTEKASDIADWIEEFIRREKGDASAFDAGWRSVLEAYVKDGFRFFAVDVIDADPMSGPVAPLRYTFAHSKGYFPLRISSQGRGTTDVALFLVAVGGQWATGDNAYLRSNRQGWRDFALTPDEAQTVDPVLGSFLKGKPAPFRCVRFQAELPDLKTDFELEFLKAAPSPR